MDDLFLSRSIPPISIIARLVLFLPVTALWSQGSQTGVQFVDVAARARVQVRDLSGGEEKISLLDTVGHGAAWVDYDQDGWLDLFVVNGSTLDRLRGRDKSRPPSFRLFRNLGDGRFSDVTARAKVEGQGLWGMGVATGDVDNDGFPDLLVTGFGRNIFYRNLGDGTFEDATAKYGLGGGGWCTGAAFGDFDRDGFLDLYVTRYVDLDIHNFPLGCLYSGIRVACGPMGLQAQHDLLYRNNGDGTFREVGASAGILEGEAYYGLGVVFLDYDRDGYPDVYVANDATPANLWHNNRDGTFSDRGTVAGCAFNGDGREQARMGVDAADFDRSGYPSIFTTNFSGETNSLFRNLGNSSFTDATEEAGLSVPSLPYLGWGVKFMDHDNDGWLDIFAVNGHIYPEVDTHGLSYTYRQRIQVFRNLGGKFGEIAAALGLKDRFCARGAAFGDYDNDGDIDVFVVTMDDMPLLLENRGGNRNNFLTVRLVGSKGNRDGIGALVKLSAGGAIRTAEMTTGGSYLSAHDPRIHFGLGTAKEADWIEVIWPGGSRERIDGVETNRFITIVEGRGITASGAGATGDSKRR